MRVQEELKEEEKRSQFKVEGILTLKEQREERGQCRLRRRAREARDGCLQDTQPGLVLSVDSWGASPVQKPRRCRTKRPVLSHPTSVFPETVSLTSVYETADHWACGLVPGSDN